MTLWYLILHRGCVGEWCRSLCAHILRVRYETPDEWRGLIKAQQETIRLPAFDRAIVSDAFKRGEKDGNNPRMVVQVSDIWCDESGYARACASPGAAIYFCRRDKMVDLDVD